ncbi:hypothetical protein GQ600_19161 [Phytophthora cactorum]|nr:hypothetical protein GQ600_19161 [Phytophthora cactorum]
MFVTRPAFLFGADEAKEVPPLAIICALGGSVMQASSYITMRQLKELNYVVINYYFLLFGLLYALATLWYFDVVGHQVAPFVEHRITVQCRHCIRHALPRRRVRVVLGHRTSRRAVSITASLEPPSLLPALLSSSYREIDCQG